MNYHHLVGCEHHRSLKCDGPVNLHRFGSCDVCVASVATRRAMGSLPCPHCQPPFDIDEVLTMLPHVFGDAEFRRLATLVLGQLLSRIEKLEQLQPVQLEQLASAEATHVPPNGEEIDT